MDLSSEKEAALEVIQQFQTIPLHLSGASVLDVGFGYGFNAAAMRKEGAEVKGVEPDQTSYKSALANNNIDDKHAICAKLQDMPTHFANHVDVATLLLWNISRSEYDDVLRCLASAIGPSGSVVIGIYDDVYISDPYGMARNPNRVEEARDEFDTLELKPNDFHAFKNTFVRLAAECHITKNQWKRELKRRLTTTLKNITLAAYMDSAVSFEDYMRQNAEAAANLRQHKAKTNDLSNDGNGGGQMLHLQGKGPQCQMPGGRCTVS
ncbi:hypothetical protein B0T21DRAFT_409412 [Apiosordaria backusii]|uniref:Methyltransferase domain-containing protein n=1 Tax=Apiosordaria backusii TaxID=314023 RepID=A0AA40EIN2_9PEZI|nr:hypothetical protein B0T21DRAFT_409412 [Apiosordaria backusii]